MRILRVGPEEWSRAILVGNHVDQAAVVFDREVDTSPEELGRQPLPGVQSTRCRKIVIAQAQSHRDRQIEVIGSGKDGFVAGGVDHVSAMQDEVDGPLLLDPVTQRLQQIRDAGAQGAYFFNFCCFGSQSAYFPMFREITVRQAAKQDSQ